MFEPPHRRIDLKNVIPAYVHSRLSVEEIFKVAGVSRACLQASESIAAWVGFVLTVHDPADKHSRYYGNTINSMSTLMLESIAHKLKRVGEKEGVATIPPPAAATRADRSPLHLRRSVFGKGIYWWLAYNTEDFGWFDRDHTTLFPIGLKVWAPCPLLCRWFTSALLSEQANIRGRSVLELGAGIGMLGTVLAHSGASRVLITDVNTCVRRVASINARINAAPNASVQRLEYGRDAGMAFRETYGRFEIIVGADIIYTSSAITPVFESVDELLVEGGTFLLGFVERNSTFAVELSRTCEDHGFKLSRSCFLADELDGPKPDVHNEGSKITGMLADLQKVLQRMPKGGSCFGEAEAKVQLLEYRRTAQKLDVVSLDEMD